MQQSKAAPEKCSQNDNEFARVPVSQRTDKRRGDHVEAEERTSQVPDLLFRDVELILHQRLDGEQYVAVRVIEQIERRQNNEGSFRLKIVLDTSPANITRGVDARTVSKTSNHKEHEVARRNSLNALVNSVPLVVIAS